MWGGIYSLPSVYLKSFKSFNLYVCIVNSKGYFVVEKLGLKFPTIKLMCYLHFDEYFCK